MGTVAPSGVKPTPLSRFISKRFVELKLKPSRVAALMGVKAPTVCNWKSGKARPSIFRLQELASHLEVDVERLLDLSRRGRRAA